MEQGAEFLHRCLVQQILVPLSAQGSGYLHRFLLCIEQAAEFLHRNGLDTTDNCHFTLITKLTRLNESVFH